MSTWEMTLPYPPVLNRLYRATTRGRVYKTPEAKRFAKTVQLVMLAEGVKRRAAGLSSAVLTGPLEVSVSLYRPRKVGDIDGPLKGLFDALNGVVWKDDSQIERLTVWRFDDAENPRVRVVVSPLGSAS